MPRTLQVSISEATTALCSAPPSDPAKSAFFRVGASERIARWATDAAYLGWYVRGCSTETFTGSGAWGVTAAPPGFRGPEDDLFESILRLRHAFILAGLQPPAVIELTSWEEGMKVLRLARTRYSDRYRRSLFNARESDEPVTQVEVSGVTVRWPARRWSRSSAGVPWRQSED
jgi:hypothetical protein